MIVPEEPVSTSVLLETRDLAVTFPIARSGRERFGRQPALAVHAVDGVDLVLTRGQALGLVGESGCGKSTLAFCLAGLIAPTGGELLLDGKRLEADAYGHRPATHSDRLPGSLLFTQSTTHRRTVLGGAVARPPPGLPWRGREPLRENLMKLVDLPWMHSQLHPRKMSGGQRQRSPSPERSPSNQTF